MTTMRVQLIESLSEPALMSAENEDSCDYLFEQNRFVAWIVDGATAVADHLPLEATPAFFAKLINKHLKSAFQKNVAIELAVKEAIERVKAEFQTALSISDLPMYALPLAAMSLISITKESAGDLKVEIFSLGDCEAIIKTKEGSVIKGAQVTSREPRVTSGEKKENVTEKIRIRRVQQHSMENPRYFAFNEKAAQYGVYSSIRTSSEVKILLCSDGFSRGWEFYGIFTLHDIFDNLEKTPDLVSLYKKIREFESTNAEKNTLYKNSDDVTVVFAHISLE